jgi:dienelactone hydrolase
MTMREVEVRYTCDGLNMLTYLNYDDAVKTPRPGVLVFPGASGLGRWCREGAQRLAKEGYVTLACDYWGNAHFDDTMDTTKSTVTALYNELVVDPPTKRRRGKAALDALLARPEVDKTKIASMGYCFGGAFSLELAMTGADIKAVVGFHTSVHGVPLEDIRKIKGRVLICNGADDPVAPPPERAAFEAAAKGTGVNWQINVYGGVVHSFTDPYTKGTDWIRYDEHASEESWAAMLRLLKNVF